MEAEGFLGFETLFISTSVKKVISLSLPVFFPLPSLTTTQSVGDGLLLGVLYGVFRVLLYA